MNFLSDESLPPQLQEAIAYQNLTTGQTLFQHGDTALTVFIVETGRLRLARRLFGVVNLKLLLPLPNSAVKNPADENFLRKA